jgi:hypothetical protein
LRFKAIPDIDVHRPFKEGALPNHFQAIVCATSLVCASGCQGSEEGDSQSDKAAAAIPEAANGDGSEALDLTSANFTTQSIDGRWSLAEHLGGIGAYNVSLEAPAKAVVGETVRIENGAAVLPGGVECSIGEPSEKTLHGHDPYWGSHGADYHKIGLLPRPDEPTLHDIVSYELDCPDDTTPPDDLSPLANLSIIVGNAGELVMFNRNWQMLRMERQ